MKTSKRPTPANFLGVNDVIQTTTADVFSKPAHLPNDGRTAGTFIEEPVRTSNTATERRETTTTGAAPAAPASDAAAPTTTTTTTATTTARASTTNDWTPDHATMNGTKEQLKALPQFKYSDYN